MDSSDNANSDLPVIFIPFLDDRSINMNISRRVTLHMAVKRGDAALVQALLTKSSIVSQSMLLESLEMDREDILDLLLSADNKFIDSMDHNDDTLLIQSVKRHALGCIGILLKHGCKINAADQHGFTALHYAVNLHNLKIVRLLLGSGTYPNSASTIKSINPISIAVTNNDIAMIHLLLIYGAKYIIKKKNIRSIFQKIIQNNMTYVLKLFIKSFIRLINVPDDTGRTALSLAAINGNCSIVRLLLSRGADRYVRDDYGMDAMYLAAWYGHYQILQMMGNESAYSEIDHKFSFKLIQYMMERLSHENLQQHNELLSHHRDDILEIFTEKFQDLMNRTDDDGWTALMSAVYTGNGDFVRILLEHGADRYVQDLYGRDALYLAIFEENWDMVQILLIGDDLKNFAIPYDGSLQHPNHLFLLIWKYAPIPLLRGLVNDASIEDLLKQNQDGCTVLHLATMQQRVDAIELLLSAKDIRDSTRRTALTYACACKNFEIAKLLLTGDINCDLESILLTEIRNDRKDIVLDLIACGVPIRKVHIEAAVDLILPKDDDDVHKKPPTIEQLKDSYIGTIFKNEYLYQMHNQNVIFHYINAYENNNIDDEYRRNFAETLRSNLDTFIKHDTYCDYTLSHIARFININDYINFNSIKFLVDFKSNLLSNKYMNVGEFSKEYKRLLQMAIDFGMEVEAGFLIQHGVDPSMNPEQISYCKSNCSPNFYRLLVESGAAPRRAVRTLQESARIAVRLRNNFLDIWRDHHRLTINILKYPNHPYDLNGFDQHGKNALHYAIESRNNIVVEDLLQDGVDPNLKDNDGNTPLHMAIQSSNITSTRLLLEHKADPKIKNNNSKNAFDLIMQQNDISSLKIFSAHHPDMINSADDDGYTALHHATVNNNLNAVYNLLKTGADPDLITNDGYTALQIAYDNYNIDLIIIIQKFGLNIPDANNNIIDYYVDDTAIDSLNGNTDLHTACMYNKIFSVYYILIKNNSDILAMNADSETALMLAIKNHNLIIENILLLYTDAYMIDVYDKKGWTALYYAVSVNSLSSADLLLKSGADPNIMPKNSLSAISMACNNSNIELVSVLLEHGADLYLRNGESWTILMIAVSNNNMEIVKMLLDAAPDLINGSDSAGCTALLNAARNSNVALSTVLLKAGADPDAKSVHGETALSVALDTKQIDLMELLLRYRVDVNVVGCGSKTPLMLAAEFRQTDVVKCLLKLAPESLNASDVDGNTALHWAMMSDSLPVVELLLAAGADPDVEATCGKTTLDMAVE